MYAPHLNIHANSRWARFGPYYAMFPVDFAFDVIEEFSSKGSSVIDPFAGRGTSIYAAATLGRKAVGIEINPVGWIYGQTKLCPAPMENVLNRLNEISSLAPKYESDAKDMSEFFNTCFCKSSLQFLLAARKNLNWRQNYTDRTLSSFILYYLHGDVGKSLSNQMKQTIAMYPDYSLRWWHSNGFSIPPVIEPEELLRSRIMWRYAKGHPKIFGEGKFFLGDSEIYLRKIKNHACTTKGFSLLLTSPPYCSVINYHADQWLRLWTLGGEPYPRKQKGKHRGRFDSKQKYRDLLLSVFSKCAMLMNPKGTIYVRTDVRKFTFECTQEILSKCFPKHKQNIRDSSPIKTQSALFKNVPLIKPGERDIILTR